MAPKAHSSFVFFSAQRLVGRVTPRGREIYVYACLKKGDLFVVAAIHFVDAYAKTLYRIFFQKNKEIIDLLIRHGVSSSLKKAYRQSTRPETSTNVVLLPHSALSICARWSLSETA